MKSVAGGKAPSGSRNQARARKSVATILTDRADRCGIAIDPYRTLIFPNAMREQRRRAGYEALLTLAARLPHIPYIRLSKIERGEVAARAEELIAIAAALDTEPTALLVDVEAADYSAALWSTTRGEPVILNREAEEMAMLLAAAFRAARAGDPSLTLAALQSQHGLAAVIVSRIENAAKAPDRWNAATLGAICAVLGLRGARALGAHLRDQHESGALDPWLARIPGEAEREARTRALIARLRQELKAPRPARAVMPVQPQQRVAETQPAPLSPTRRLVLRGLPLGDGLIDPRGPTGDIIPAGMQQAEIDAPAGAGPNAYALRMCRPTLGAAIPGHAVLIVDPDRFPVGGGLAVLRETAGKEEALRVVTITTDREGRMVGHSLNPEKQIPLDVMPPADIAMVTAILLG